MLTVSGIVLLIALSAAWLPAAARRNQGSLAYLRSPLQNRTQPAADHPRRIYWQATVALAGGDAAADLMLPGAATGDRVAQHLAAWSAFRAGDAATAADLWEQYRDDRSLNKAINENIPTGAPADTYTLFRALDRLDPRDAAAGYARFLAAQGAVDQAIALLTGLVAQHPAASQRSAWLDAAAEILRSAGRQAEAVAALTLLAAEPGQAGPALTELGRLYDQAGDPTAALAALQQATRQDPGYAEAYAAAAAILTRRGEYGDADRWYADALARQPARGDWALARANARQAAGDLAGSRQLLVEIVDAYPGQAGVQYAAARSLAQAELWPAAATAIEQAIAATPKPNAAYHRLAATIYRALGDATTAARHEQAAATP